MNDHRQRGFAIVTALVLALLYFALMELLLVDSSRAQAEAQRFRARVQAEALAESGAERAALQMIVKSGLTVSVEIDGSPAKGEYIRNSNNFELHGHGTALGAVRQEASVRVQGRIDPVTNAIKIDYTMHGQ